MLSGGLDSGTCLALLARWGWMVHAISFDYSQRHRVELRAARRLAGCIGVASHPGAEAIPVTYVPARNTIFLAFALAVAEVSRATEIVIGASSLDYSGYPDCRPPFLGAVRARARRFVPRSARFVTPSLTPAPDASTFWACVVDPC